MSLLTLLRVGNSFSPIEDHRSRYQMCRQNLLPHFGDLEEAAAREFARPAARSGPGPDPANGESASGRRRLSGVSGACWSGGGPSVRSTAAAPGAIPCAYPEGRWSARRAFWRAGGAAGRSAAHVEGAPVQRDLPWEAIAVARNDLSEGDLEVVAVPREPAPPGAAAAGRAPKGASGSLLDRLKASWRRGAGSASGRR
ncbi:MAG: hypothetical protein JXQ71_13900 [Verrucomicrobia bacterium]|nr:hypothetical protein [Verrucomicrobiota bacterium]